MANKNYGLVYENKNYKILNECFNKLDEFHQLINRELPLQSLAEKVAELNDEMEEFRRVS